MNETADLLLLLGIVGIAGVVMAFFGFFARHFCWRSFGNSDYCATSESLIERVGKRPSCAGQSKW